MDRNKNNRSTWIVTILSVIGSIASIYFVVKEQLGLAFIVMASIVILLLVFVLIFSKKYREYRGFYKARSELEKLSDTLRSYFTELTDSNNVDDVELSLQDVMSQALEHSSRTLTLITGKNCTASLMMPDQNNHFETIKYSTNAPTDRTRVGSQPLPHDKGIIGKAFNANIAINWCLKTNKDGFEEIRDGFDRFYKSGIVCPIIVCGEAFAILNIDANDIAVFGESEKDLASFFANILSCAFEAGENLWDGMEAE